MIWCKFRGADGEPQIGLTPMATCQSFTITKTGALFFRKDGTIQVFHPKEDLAEIHDNYTKYVLTDVEVVGTNAKYQEWQIRGPLDVGERLL